MYKFSSAKNSCARTPDATQSTVFSAFATTGSLALVYLKIIDFEKKKLLKTSTRQNSSTFLSRLALRTWYITYVFASRRAPSALSGDPVRFCSCEVASGRSSALAASAELLTSPAYLPPAFFLRTRTFAFVPLQVRSATDDFQKRISSNCIDAAKANFTIVAFSDRIGFYGRVSCLPRMRLREGDRLLLPPCSSSSFKYVLEHSGFAGCVVHEPAAKTCVKKLRC